MLIKMDRSPTGVNATPFLLAARIWGTVLGVFQKVQDLTVGGSNPAPSEILYKTLKITG